MEGMIACPHCQRADRQVRAGMSGDSQRYKCGYCGRRYTPSPRPRGYPDDVRTQARQLRGQGLTAREIGLRLDVPSRSVANWVRLPSEPLPAPEAAPAPAVAAPERPSWRRPTIHDVAGRAGVSTSTVSNYLNQRGRMSETTGRRIQAAIEALHFTPSALMRALRQHRTQILGVYIGGLDILDENPNESVTLPLLAGINRGASAGTHNLLYFTGYERHAKRTPGREFLDGHIDGLIWVTPPLRSPTLERLADAGLPVVALLSRHVPDGVGYVNADNLGAFQALVAHLASLGHRRIAYIGPVHDSNHWDRREGYRQGLAAVGLSWASSLEVSLAIEGDWVPETFDRIPGFDRALRRWLSLTSPPTAIILPDDGLAVSLGRALLRRGLRVPEDITVSGFNDIPDAAVVFGGLTTFRQPLRQMGQMAAERLLALIGGASVDECRVTVPAELVIRTSTFTLLP